MINTTMLPTSNTTMTIYTNTCTRNEKSSGCSHSVVFASSVTVVQATTSINCNKEQNVGRVGVNLCKKAVEDAWKDPAFLAEQRRVCGDDALLQTRMTFAARFLRP